MGKADLDIETRRAMQLVAREEMKRKIYADILTDMMICEIEGWDRLEYIKELQDMFNSLIKQKQLKNI